MRAGYTWRDPSRPAPVPRPSLEPLSREQFLSMSPRQREDRILVQRARVHALRLDHERRYAGARVQAFREALEQIERESRGWSKR